MNLSERLPVCELNNRKLLEFALNRTGREDSQEQHLVAENERLRSQLNELQKQHAQLRQSELRLRNVAAQASVAQPTSTQTRAVVESRAGNSSLLLAVAVLMALLIGLLLGRFVV